MNKNTKAEHLKYGTPFYPYERESDYILRPTDQIVIRMDGVSMTTSFLNTIKKEQYEIFHEIMTEIALELCSENESTAIAYLHDDEINIVLSGRYLLENNDNRLQKICSKYTSLATLKLTEKLFDSTLDEIKGRTLFSTKVFNLPYHLIHNYCKWRQLGSINYNHEVRKIDNKYRYGTFVIFEDGKWQIKRFDLHGDKSPNIYLKTNDVKYSVTY